MTVRSMSSRTASVFLAVGIVAVLVQHWLVPLDAPNSFGLFSNGGDLMTYRFGGLRILHRELLYATEIPDAGWFTYTPFAALLFAPLGFVSLGTAKVLWFVMNMGALFAIIWRCWRVLGYAADSRLAVACAGMTLLALDIQPVHGTLWQGQVNLVLAALIIWDLTRPDGARWRGWSVGVASGVKLTAIIFLPYLLVSRQWRAAVASIATAIGTVALGWIVLPSDSSDYWLSAVRTTDHIGSLDHPGNASIGGALSNLYAPQPMPTWLWVLLAGVAALLGMAAAWRAHRAGRELLAVAVVGMVGCVVSPLAWGHHWVWTVPLIVLLVNQILTTRGVHRWQWAAVTAVIGVVVFMWQYVLLYIRAMRIDPNFQSYITGWDAVIAHMSKAERAFDCAALPLLFLVVAIWVLTTKSLIPESDTGTVQE
ncbi:glycosyltransferase 87 family protein [Mycobacterium sp. NPDC050853]|uniref:glycosyltransferase 87 family protein n=1 Tax=Mycobacterium sp. NPDC050853 TaxID=3155160 RepID=UPI0033D61571